MRTVILLLVFPIPLTIFVICHVQVAELDNLQSKILDLPIYVKESENLIQILSSVKV